MTPRDARAAVEQYSLVRLLQNMIDNAGRLHERSCFEGMEGARLARSANRSYDGTKVLVPFHALSGQRDLTTGTDVSAGFGGYLTDSRLESMGVLEPLAEYSAVLSAGAQVHAGLVSNVPAPRVVGDPTVAWLETESSPIPDSNPTLAGGELSPHSAGAFVKISRKLLQVAPVAEAVTRRALRRSLAEAMDRVVMVGTGTAGEPLGLSGQSGYATASGAGLSWASIASLRSTMIAGAGTDSRLAWIGGAATQRVLSTREKAAGNGFIWDLGGADAGNIGGHRARATRSMPTDALASGDWSACHIAQWGPGIEISVDPFSSFQTGIVGIRAILIMDVTFADIASFGFVKDIT